MRKRTVGLGKPRRIAACGALICILGVLVWVSPAGSAGSSPINVRVPAHGFTLPKPQSFRQPGAPPAPVVPASPPGNRLVLQFLGTLSCPPVAGQPVATCTALASLVAPRLGPLRDVTLALFGQTFSSSQQPISLGFGLSQHSVDLLYKYRDPRCTAVVVVAEGQKAFVQNVPVMITVK
jgi:hypothetical protein